MVHRYISRLAAALLLLTSVGIVRAQTSSAEKDELKLGEHAILSRLALMSTSPYLCSEQPSHCISADGVELGTALVAARNTPQSLRSLTRLLRFHLDASYGETYDEHLCRKGKKLEAYLIKLDPKDLRSECLREFNDLVKANPKELGEARVNLVCASEVTIRTKLRDTLEMVRKPPASCEP